MDKNRSFIKCLDLIVFIFESLHMALSKLDIAKRIAKELKNGMYVNLGIGIPLLAANFIQENSNVVLQTENGILGLGPYPEEFEIDADLINPAKETVTILPGGAFFDSAESFGMIRAGKIDIAVLGAMQVSERGDIANWKVPGKKIRGVGGAMDLIAGVKKIIVAMQHTNQNNESKLVQECTLPLTGIACVHMVITDLAVIDITTEGFLLREKAPGVSIEEIRKRTAGRLVISSEVIEMEF